MRGTPPPGRPRPYSPPPPSVLSISAWPNGFKSLVLEGKQRTAIRDPSQLHPKTLCRHRNRSFFSQVMRFPPFLVGVLPACQLTPNAACLRLLSGDRRVEKAGGSYSPTGKVLSSPSDIPWRLERGRGGADMGAKIEAPGQVMRWLETMSSRDSRSEPQCPCHNIGLA